MTDWLATLAAALSDRYRIEVGADGNPHLLGEGGMATVYLALDLKHRRKVAVKVLRPELAAIVGADRFLAEINVTASLQHPHILPLFDSGEAGGQLFYVMPYVAGESLRARLERERQLPVQEALRFAREIASALEYAHRLGVIHRDIKPENILLQDGAALVSDFGIALAVSNAGGARMTQTGLSLGTPSYMSPEQAAGERTVDARSDVYALAAMCYEMLTGQAPFVAPNTQGLIVKLMTEKPLPPSVLRKSVPPHVDAAILTALEKLPADRPSTASAFSSALDAQSAPLPAHAVVQPRWGWRSALAVGTVLGLLAGALGAGQLMNRSSSASQDQRAQMTFTGQATKPALSPDGAFVAYVDVRCAHSQVDLCRFSLLVQERGSTQAIPILTGALDLSAPRWSHDGTLVVVAGALDSSRIGLFAVPRLGGAPRRFGPAGTFDTHPNGDTVVVILDRDSSAVALILSLANDHVMLDSIPLRFGGIGSVSWAPGGRHLAFNMWEDGLKIIDRNGKETASEYISSRNDVRWSQRGDAVLTFRTGVAREDELVRIAVDGAGKIRGTPEVVMSRVQTLYQGEFDVARGTGRLAMATGTATADIWTFDLSAGVARAQQRTRGTTYYGSPTLSADGRKAFYLRGDALGDNVYALNLADGAEEALTSLRLPAWYAVRISDDQRRLVFGHLGEKSRILEVLDLPSSRVTSRVTKESALDWPIGERGILRLDFLGRIMTLDSLEAPERILPIPDSLRDVVRFAPAPDGRQAAFLAQTSNGLVLGIISLADGKTRVLRSFGREAFPGLSWDRDGQIYLGRWLLEEETPSIWRVTATSAELTRVASLPTPCEPATIIVAANGRSAICLVVDNRSDVWIIDRIGLGR